ncbi:MAG: hypothetical protein HYR60_09595 [Acidobacteria bacterium]|nr:hypothetical protein [Acidobacteriota bacterium]MBI3473076.1 hypothetical protein [Candidatus Solibacter usitatus]
MTRAVSLLLAAPALCAVTFTQDVAPILFRHCAECHRPGQVAPFPLLSYADAAPRAAMIAKLTAARRMPPWKPEPGPLRFAGERRLTAAQIAILQRWSATGAPQGNPADLPPLPRFPEGWQLGAPDLVVEMPAPFAAPPDGPDIYRCFVAKPALPADRYVRAMEFRPGSRRALHHALVFADSSGAARQKEGADGSPGYPCFGAPGFLPSAGLGGWTPGMAALPFPEGVAIRLRKGSDLVLQIHYHPTGKAESDRSSLALYFSEKPPEKKLFDVPLGSREIDIAPGEPDYRVRDRFTLPVGVWAVGVIPHAHYICREIRGVAMLPGGARLRLLSIKDWDFNWQQQYRYEKPVRLPAGTRLEMEFIYDNSGRNPRNPSSPPKRVLWGPDSTDEMSGLHVQVIPERPEDASELGRALWGKFMRTVGGRFYTPAEKK